MKRLQLFVKGNVDVHDSLHSCRIGGTLEWNGVNEVMRAQFPGTTIRIKHETLTRSDALLAASGEIPSDFASLSLPLEPYSQAMQFSRAIFDTFCDAVVLTIQPDVCTVLYQHRCDGYTIYPNNLAEWRPAARAWLRDEFILLGRLDCETSMAQLEKIIARLRAERDVPVLIYNVSSFVPGEISHCLQGLGDTFPRRARRFNAALEDLSERTGISIIDVETIVARGGADRLKIDALHLTAQGYRLVAEEVARVLHDIGLLDEGEN